jgi:hypothetical protein
LAARQQLPVTLSFVKEEQLFIREKMLVLEETGQFLQPLMVLLNSEKQRAIKLTSL